MNKLLLPVLFLLFFSTPVFADTWQTDSAIASGLGDIGGYSTPTVFQKDSTWYLIYGDINGLFYGYNWTGSTWQPDSAINSSLGDIGFMSAPTVFQKDGTWYLIAGEQSGVFYGYNWTGSTWQSDIAIASGLGDVGFMSAPTVFQKDETWYLIAGEWDGVFYGYNWTGSTWQNDSAIASGLGDIGGRSVPTVFQKDETWYLIAGEGDGVFYGFNISDTTAPTITIASPTNTTYSTTSIDLNWSANEILLDAWYSLNGAGNVSLIAWQSDSAIASGLGDSGYVSAPTVFQKDGTWYLISGEYVGFFTGEGIFNGFNWTGSTWQNDSAIVSGLGGVGDIPAPTVFQKDGTWYLISGEYEGVFNGFNWTGSTWQNDSAIASGLGDVGLTSAPTVFQKDSTWYLIAGENDGVFNGYNWTGSTWQNDSAIVSGLGDVGIYSAPKVFQKDGTWYLISGEDDGVFNGYNWTGSTWQSDSAIASGLGDVGYNSAPTVFQKDETWYLISGEKYGSFFGYEWNIHNTTITAVEGSNNVTVYANDTAGNVGSATEYFSVSTFASNAVFSIAMPSDYSSFTNVSGENETDATAYDWISFNFTERPQYYVQPYQLGNATNTQNGATQPIFLIDNVGNVNIDLSFRFESALPTGITVEGNASCSGTYTSCQSSSIELNTSYITLVENISYTDSFANITLYSNMSSEATPTTTGITLYIKGVES